MHFSSELMVQIKQKKVYGVENLLLRRIFGRLTLDIFVYIANSICDTDTAHTLGILLSNDLKCMCISVG